MCMAKYLNNFGSFKERYDSALRLPMSVDRFRLIEEVRKRPLLWDRQNLPKSRSKERCAVLWADIAQLLNVDVNTCKDIWSALRSYFCQVTYQISIRITRAKRKGKYDPNKKYYSWPYFDALRFLVDGISAQAKFDISFGYNSDIEKAKNNTSRTKTKSEFCGNSSIQAENVNDSNFDNYGSGDEIEIIVVDNSDQTQDQQEHGLEDDLLPTESDKISPVNPADDYTVDTNFKSYMISLTNCVLDRDCTSTLNNNTVLQADSFVKEEPELQIESENEDISDLQEFKSAAAAHELTNCTVNPDLPGVLNENVHNEFEEYISSPPKFKHQVSSLPGFSDEDYSFLYSFVSQTKAMTQLQKIEFRGSMEKLLVKIAPASASINSLGKHILLPQDNNPDRQFLISFWPFMKSMSSLQNLQFRAKMADLVLQILSNEAVL